MLLTGSIWWISVVELGHYSIGRQLKRHFVFWPNALNFPNKCAANTQRVFLLLVFNVLALPSDFVLAPPGLRRMLLVRAAIGQTHPSHWLDFWGEILLLLVPNLAFWQEWFSVLAAGHTFNGEPRFPFWICFTFLSHLVSCSVYSTGACSQSKKQTWTLYYKLISLGETE